MSLLNCTAGNVVALAILLNNYRQQNWSAAAHLSLLWFFSPDAKGVGAIMVLPFLVNERGGEIFTEMVRIWNILCDQVS